MKINETAVSHSIFINVNINVLTCTNHTWNPNRQKNQTKVYVGKIITSSQRVYYRLKEKEYKNMLYTNRLSICLQTMVE